MKLFKFKDKNIICFHKSELSELFSDTRKTEILEEMLEQKISFDDLRKDYSKAGDVVDGALRKTRPNDRDEHEIFASLFIFPDFFEDESEICFEVSSHFDPIKNKIGTLKDLNRLREGSRSDFIIKSNDGFREFQLKRYRGDLSVGALFEFIKSNVQHYANDLGEMNLLILFQPKPFSASDINFYELSAAVKSLNFKFAGEILITFNQGNRELFIIRLYPEFGATKKPIKLPSGR